MKILFIGDVFGQTAAEKLVGFLPKYKHDNSLGLIIINGENSADGNGITPHSAKLLFEAGADVITTGNHCFKRREMDSAYAENENVLRPLNLGNAAVGNGYVELDFAKYRVMVVSLIGTTYMQPADNPFKTMDELLEITDIKNVIVDFHAEATAEKKAMGYYLDGRVSAVLGTHTHVQTADAAILEGRTAYITDVGMTGVHDSVLGVEKKAIIERFLTYYPQKHVAAKGEVHMNAVMLELDVSTGSALSIEAVRVRI